MKNKVIILIIVILNLQFFSGCGVKREKELDAVTITFWHSFVASTHPALKELIIKFEDEYPNIHVKAQYIPTGDALVQKLVTAVQSKTVPDISWIHSDFLDKLVLAGAIYDMDEFISGANGLSQEILDDIFPALLQSASWRGTMYAMPMEATSLALLYNRTAFRKAGLDPDSPPQNWDELQKYSKILTIDENHDGIYDQYGFYVPVFPASGSLSIWMVLQWTPFLWQAGGRIINTEQNNVLFNSDAGVQALTLWKNIYDELNLKTFTLSHDMGFAAGRLAMILDGPWNLPRYRNIKELDWAVAPLPAGPVQRATYLAGEHLAIFRQSGNPAEAWTFIKWILQPEIQAMFSIQSGYLPVRKSVLTLRSYQDYLETDPYLRAFVGQMQYARGRQPVDYFHTEMNQIIAETIEKVILGGGDPKTELDKAALESNQLLRSKH